MWWALASAGVLFRAQLVLTAPVTGSVLAPPRLQLLALKLPPPGGTLLALQLTVPLGEQPAAGLLSGTVPVCRLLLATGTGSGAQLPTLLVACLFAVSTTLPAVPRRVVSLFF